MEVLEIKRPTSAIILTAISSIKDTVTENLCVVVPSFPFFYLQFSLNSKFACRCLFPILVADISCKGALRFEGTFVLGCREMLLVFDVLVGMFLTMLWNAQMYTIWLNYFWLFCRAYTNEANYTYEGIFKYSPIIIGYYTVDCTIPKYISTSAQMTYRLVKYGKVIWARVQI